MKKTDWQPIETAPKDGTVILTDEGTAAYLDDYFIRAGWYLMGIHDQFPPKCADDGYSISSISPRFWQPLPEMP